METYLQVTFSSEGSPPSEVAERLRALGFKPIHGNYDFVYDWKREVAMDDTMDLADQLTQLLKGYKVLFETETV
jgi:DNA-binding ferritin-like protein